MRVRTTLACIGGVGAIAGAVLAERAAGPSVGLIVAAGVALPLGLLVAAGPVDRSRLGAALGLCAVGALFATLVSLAAQLGLDWLVPSVEGEGAPAQVAATLGLAGLALGAVLVARRLRPT